MNSVGACSEAATVWPTSTLRDTTMPYILRKIFRREVLLISYSQRGLENARRAKDELFMYQNSRKARLGGLAGLQDPAVMNQKLADETALRRAAAEAPNLRPSADAWDQVAAAVRTAAVESGCAREF